MAFDGWTGGSLLCSWTMPGPRRPSSARRSACRRLRSSAQSTGSRLRRHHGVLRPDRPSALGWATEAYVELFCRGRTSPPQIAAAVSKHQRSSRPAPPPARLTRCSTSGPSDMRHFEQVVERISAEPLIVRTRSVIVLSRLVHRPDTAPTSEQARAGQPRSTVLAPRNGWVGPVRPSWSCATGLAARALWGPPCPVVSPGDALSGGSFRGDLPSLDPRPRRAGGRCHPGLRLMPRWAHLRAFSAWFRADLRPASRAQNNVSRSLDHVTCEVVGQLTVVEHDEVW